MAAAPSILAFAPLRRTERTLLDRLRRRPGRTTAELDVLLDGRSLDAEVNGGRRMRLSCPLGWTGPFADAVRAELLLESEASLAGGRRPLLASHAAEGPWCSVISVVVEADGPDIVWRDFAFQLPRDPSPALDWLRHLGPYRFESEAYRAAVGAARPSPPVVASG